MYCFNRENVSDQGFQEVIDGVIQRDVQLRVVRQAPAGVQQYEETVFAQGSPEVETGKGAGNVIGPRLGVPLGGNVLHFPVDTGPGVHFDLPPDSTRNRMASWWQKSCASRSISGEWNAISPF